MSASHLDHPKELKGLNILYMYSYLGPEERHLIFHHQSIYTNFYLLLLLWPLTRKAKVKKGQDRCQIKQLLNRGLGCDPQIRNGDPSQQQGKTFLWAVAQSLKCNWDLQPGLKKKLVFFICLLIFSSLRIEAIFPFYLWLPVVDMREGELVYGKCSHHEKWGWAGTAESAAESLSLLPLLKLCDNRVCCVRPGSQSTARGRGAFAVICHIQE